VLPSRHLHLLPAQHRQRPRTARARRLRHDYVIDIAALGGDEGRQKPLLVFLGAAGDFFGVADVGAEDDLDGALGAITAICVVGQA
jgi:hypothetical protein